MLGFVYRDQTDVLMNLLAAVMTLRLVIDDSLPKLEENTLLQKILNRSLYLLSTFLFPPRRKLGYMRFQLAALLPLLLFTTPAPRGNKTHPKSILESPNKSSAHAT